MEKLLLKPRTLEHVEIFFRKTQDAEIERLFPSNRITLNEAIKLFEESLKSNAKSYGKVIYIDNKYIGDVWCYGIDESEEKQAFVSIVIFDKTCWGQGIGKIALKEFCQLLFEKYDFKKLCAFTYCDNKRSIGTLENIGFKLIEKFKEDGVDSFYFELLNQ